MEFILLYLAGAVAVGLLADTRDRSVSLWLVLSLLISPLIAGIIVLVIGQAPAGGPGIIN